MNNPCLHLLFVFRLLSKSWKVRVGGVPLLGVLKRFLCLTMGFHHLPTPMAPQFEPHSNSNVTKKIFVPPHSDVIGFRLNAHILVWYHNNVIHVLDPTAPHAPMSLKRMVHVLSFHHTLNTLPLFWPLLKLELITPLHTRHNSFAMTN